jgi:hypothetical protein
LLAASLFGGQSLSWPIPSTRTFADPNLATTASWRVEFQLHGFSAPTATSDLVKLLGVGLKITATPYGGQGLWIQTSRDSVSPAEPCIIAMEGRTNSLVRIQRDYAAMTYSCEIWEVDGSNYFIDRLAITSANAWGNAGGELWPIPDGGAKLGFLRVFSTLVPLRSRPPVTADSGDGLELKFDGNGNDSSGNGRNLNSITGLTFESSPAQLAYSKPTSANTPYWANFIPLRAGHPGQLVSNSYSMVDASADVACLWQQLDGPSQAVFDNRNSCTPTLTGLVFGSYKFRLAVTDSTGQKASLDTDIGAVAYDDNGIVIYPDARLDDLLGPQHVRGQNPWAYADQTQYTLTHDLAMDYKVNGGYVQLPNLRDDILGVPIAGTIWWDEVNPTWPYTRTLHGVGTQWLSLFCGGTPGALSPVDAVFWLVPDVVSPAYGGVGGIPRPLAQRVRSCVSDTEITAEPYLESERDITVAAPGIRWGLFFGQQGNMGNWTASNAMSIGYYDTGLAYFRAWYRSGDIAMLRAAQYMAKVQFRNPYFAQWVGRSEPTVSVTLAATLMPEIWEGKDPWPMITNRILGCLTDVTRDQPNDQREDAYCVWAAAIIAKYHPNPTTRSDFRAKLITHYNLQAIPNRYPNGGYYSFYPNFQDTARVWQATNGSDLMTLYSGPNIGSDYCGTPFQPGGSATVNVGGTVLTGTGTNWVGTGGKNIMLVGLRGGQPHMEIDRIAGTPTPTATSATLEFPWRGDAGAITRFYVEGDVGYPIQHFEGVTSAGAVKSPRAFELNDAYACTVESGTQIRLHKPFAGDTSGGNVYRRLLAANKYSIYSPWARQPFMDELRANAYVAAAKALEADEPTMAANYWTLVGSLLTLNFDNLDPLSLGQPYFDSMPTCGPRDPTVKTICDFDLAGPYNVERDYSMEGVDAFTAYYLHTLNPADKTRGDEYYRLIYSRPGYAAPLAGDGKYVAYMAQPEDGGATGDDARQKALGQAYGMGGGSTWPAARLGGPAPAENRTLTVQVGSPLAYGDRIRITATNASGVAVTNTCQAVACSVTSDFRAGGQTVLIEYLNASSAVLARATQNVIVN